MSSYYKTDEYRRELSDALSCVSQMQVRKGETGFYPTDKEWDALDVVFEAGVRYKECLE
jgi:hypothetical protein